jgi:hypothetical protein
MRRLKDQGGQIEGSNFLDGRDSFHDALDLAVRRN